VIESGDIAADAVELQDGELLNVECDFFGAVWCIGRGDGDHGGVDDAGVFVGGEVGAVDKTQEGFVVFVMSGDGWGRGADGTRCDVEQAGRGVVEGELVSHTRRSH
jgi:hypothetical protein